MIRNESMLTRSLASIVPYRAYQTADGEILLGGGNERLFGFICERLGHAEWRQDRRFETNSLRVQNRDELDKLIEDVTKQKTTPDWLAIFEGSGVPYAAINDIQQTLNHEHGWCISFDQSLDETPSAKDVTHDDSTCEGHGERDTPSRLRFSTAS